VLASLPKNNFTVHAILKDALSTTGNPRDSTNISFISYKTCRLKGYKFVKLNVWLPALPVKITSQQITAFDKKTKQAFITVNFHLCNPDFPSDHRDNKFYNAEI
jgi:hypothetical protein